MDTTPTPTITPETPAAPTPDAVPEAWEAFLEEEGDCCGGCHHKPR
jgi:hypothetical protein